MSVRFYWGLIGMLLIGLSIQSGCLLGSRVARDNPPAPGKASITGTVTLKTSGEPVSGANVLLCRDAMPLAGCTNQLGETKTDSNGRYWFRNISPGEYVPAVRMSDQSIFVLQKRGVGQYIEKSIRYPVSANQTLEIDAIALEDAPAETHISGPSLIYPVGSESVADRRPELRWEAFPEAEYYSVVLSKVDTQPETEIKLTEHPFEPIKATSIRIPTDLEDGMYQWNVFVSTKTLGNTSNVPRQKGFFTVAVKP